nr:hypothetical protein BaRGS_006560 [Batillaria attramentaria]
MNGHGEIFSNVSEDGTSTMETPRFHTGPANASALAVPEGCRMVQRTEFVPWDNPENLISHEVQQAMDDFLKVVALPICFVICAPTNVLNMAVFYKQA